MTSTNQGPELASRVVLRPYATALPLGLAGFAVGMLMLAGLGLGWFPPAQGQVVAVVVAGFVAPIQFLAATFALLSRDSGAAALLGLFSASWLAIGLAILVSGTVAPSRVMGVFLLGFAMVVLVPSVVLFSAKVLLGILAVLSSARAVLQAVWELSGSPLWHRVDGVVALVLAALGLYLALALLVEDVRGGTPVPIGRMGEARASVRADRMPSADALSAEPGVRGQL